MNQVILNTNDLILGYQSKEEDIKISEKLNLSLNAGELVCLLGPNGAGKSTLIRTLLGMQAVISGSIEIKGILLSSLEDKQRSKLISAMMTDKIDVDFLNVFDLVCFGRYPHTHWLRGIREEDREIALAALKSMEVDQFSNKSFNHLSDGEKQRVLIARALAQDTDILLLDEPTSFLDIPHKVETIRLLRKWAYEKNKAVLLSTHDFELAMNCADRMWLMQKNKDMADGAPEDLMINGSIAQCFNSEYVKMNQQTGHFEISQDYQFKVQLNCKNKDLEEWTKRSLNRVGIDISHDESSLTIIAQYKENSPTWNVMIDQVESSFDSIYACLQFIKSKQV